LVKTLVASKGMMFSEQTQESAISTREILEAVSNDTSLRLLDFIAGDHRLNTEDLLNQLSITRKQYYMRTSKFVDSGLIRRIGNRYFLTSFGSVIYELYSILREVINRKVWAYKITLLRFFAHVEFHVVWFCFNSTYRTFYFLNWFF